MTIKAPLSTALMACALAVLAPGAARAHHSHTMFDLHKEIAVTGTVKAFAFTNPHAYLYVDVLDASKKPVTHMIEMSHVQNMIRRGITAATFKPGDRITVNLNPFKDGRPGGSYVTVIDARGKKYE